MSKNLGSVISPLFLGWGFCRHVSQKAVVNGGRYPATDLSHHRLLRLITGSRGIFQHHWCVPVAAPFPSPFRQSTIKPERIIRRNFYFLNLFLNCCCRSARVLPFFFLSRLCVKNRKAIKQFPPSFRDSPANITLPPFQIIRYCILRPHPNDPAKTLLNP